jgi:integrase
MSKASMVYLEPDEVLALLKAAKAKSTRTFTMILVAYRHGLRASEVCNLRLADVNLKEGTISVDRLKGSMRTVQAITAHRGQPLSARPDPGWSARPGSISMK